MFCQIYKVISILYIDTAPVTLKTYPATLDGMVESWSDRFPIDDGGNLDKLLVSMHMFTSYYFDLPDPQMPDSEPQSPPPSS